MRFRVRRPSLKRRIRSRTSIKRHIVHRVGIKMPREGQGGFTFVIKFS